MLGGRRIEAEVRPLVRDAERQDATRERETLPRPEHRLVREIEHDVGLVPLDRGLDRALERDPIPLIVASELLDATDEHRSHDDVLDLLQGGTDHGWVVLAVHDRDDSPHPLVVTSRSIRPVYFSYSNVSVENWMIRSSPWNGCLREIDTWWPLTSTTL